MLYYLVGSRDLDGGLMCTASHNPKRYTGAKLVRRGAIALSGDAGIGDVRAKIEAGLGERSRRWLGRARLARTRSSRRPRCGSSTPSAVKPLRVVVDGGNGMAGPMVGPLLRATRARPGRDLLGARRPLPRPRAQPAAAREPRVHHARGRPPEGRPRDRLGRRRRPLLLHRRHGVVRRRRLPDRAARRVDARRRSPARRSCTTSARAGRSRTPPSRPAAAP